MQAGRDATGKTLSLGGNPLTGPFYIEGANPGDVVIRKAGESAPESRSAPAAAKV